MSITKHKSVKQMRKDYGVYSQRASHQSYAQHPTTIRAATSRAVHLYQRFSSPDVTGELQPLPGTSIQTYGGFGCLPLSLTIVSIVSPHNRILTKLDRTEKQLEELKAANRKLLDLVEQLIARPAKRRRVLVFDSHRSINTDDSEGQAEQDQNVDGVYMPLE